jgi:PRC-barrel domain
MMAAVRGARRCAVLAGVPVLLALGTLGCNTTRPTAPPPAAAAVETAPPAAPTEEPETSAAPRETPPAAAAEAPATASAPPPCVCSQPARKPHVRHKPKPKQPVEEPEPQSVEPAPPPANTVVNAEVGRIDGPLTSILGKNVRSPKGEDLGRVVDLLADPAGRVRVAIIDFGGFLGVGTRRLAVDWPLLHFNPGDKDEPLILTVTREKLQSTPEYKDSSSPRVLMPPAAAPDAAGADAKK